MQDTTQPIAIRRALAMSNAKLKAWSPDSKPKVWGAIFFGTREVPQIVAKCRSPVLWELWSSVY